MNCLFLLNFALGVFLELTLRFQNLSIFFLECTLTSFGILGRNHKGPLSHHFYGNLWVTVYNYIYIH